MISRGAPWVALQQPRQLIAVQAMSAHHGPVQQQHRHLEPVTALQLRVGIDVDDLEWRKRQRAAEGGELLKHLIAQLTVAPMHDREAAGHHRSVARRRGSLRLQLTGDEAYGGRRHLTNGGDLVAIDHGRKC